MYQRAGTGSSAPGRENRKDGSDYIFVVDIGGMRVVHFGDLGRDALTPAQMSAIGHADVAISQLGNAISDVDAANRRGFNPSLDAADYPLTPPIASPETM